MYLVFEGVVGTGKTTQSKRLLAYLQHKYPQQEIIRVREPGSSTIAEAIRNLVQAQSFTEEMQPLTDVYLYAAARAQLLGGIIYPALSRGAWVISDRNVCSSLAIQGVAQGIGRDVVWEINKAALGDLFPTKIFFFDLPVEEGLRRTFDASGDKRESASVDFYQAILQGYKKTAHHAFFSSCWQTIDASGEQDLVFLRIEEQILSLLS